MKFFTNEEFDRIFREIVVEKPICFDTLLMIAERALIGSVRKWCYEDPRLQNEDHVDEVMQLVRIRLYQKCVTGFFLRNNQPNYDPEGFKNWIFTVALNVKKDYAKKVRQEALHRGEEPIGFEPIAPSDDEDLCCSEEEIERLKRAFHVVLCSDAKVHIPLTWLALMILMKSRDTSKIKSTDLLIRCFDSMTLDAMLTLLVRFGTAIPWLELDPADFDFLKARLDKIGKDGMRMGDKVYGDFYMKKGAQASVSDWVYRMNQTIKKEEENRK